MVSPGFVRKVDRGKAKKNVSKLSCPGTQTLPGSSIPSKSYQSGSQFTLSPASRQILDKLYGPDVLAPSVPDLEIIGNQEVMTNNTEAESSGPLKRPRGSSISSKSYGIRSQGTGSLKRPVGEYSTMFTTEVGVLVRQIAPLQAMSWAAVSTEKKDFILSVLRDKFVFSKEDWVTNSVKSIMESRYNNWRHKIHLEFLKYKSVVVALASPPPFDIAQNDWFYLCNLFCTEKFKATSARNKKNKDKLKTTHCAGTKSFAKIRYDKRNIVSQTNLGFVEMYEITHQRSDGSWVHENAQMFYESLKDNKTRADLEGISLTDEQLSVQTFGRKSGYICGLGHGPKPTYSATGKKTRAELEREAYEAVKRAESAEKTATEARKETAELIERMKTLEAEQAEFSVKLKAEMSSQFATEQAAFSARLQADMRASIHQLLGISMINNDSH